MPNAIWHYLDNQFDNVTKGSRKRMNAILADTHAKLTSGAAANPAIAPILAVLTPAKAAWDTAYDDWQQARAAWRSRSQQLDNLLYALRLSPAPDTRSKIDRWESKVAAEWAKDDPVYAFLFPRGREPFTTGTREEIIGEVDNLGDRLTAKAAELAGAQATLLTDLGTEVTAFHTQLQAARNSQQQDEGSVDQLAALCEQRRVESATALYRVLAKLMDHFAAPEERAQIEGFFDLTLIMNPPAPGEDDLPPADPPPQP